MLGCCGSARWAARMAKSRPYASVDDACAAADAHWREMLQDDFLEAFRAHPKIGDPDSAQSASAESRATAAREQSGVNHASRETLNELARCNAAYEKKFGFIFIVCASGKSAEQMLTMLQSRIENGRDAEIENAGEEQRKIMQLRLRKLFETEEST